MKRLSIILSCCSLVCSGYSQSQELEQLKLNLEKLAQLKLMLAQAKRGYEVMAQGYDAMRDAARGNFRQHQQYLDQLLAVGPAVRSAPALRRLAYNVAQVTSLFEGWRRKLVPLALLSANEWTAIQRRYALIKAGAASVSDQAATLLTSGVLRMSDGERIAALTSLTEKSEEYLRDLQTLIDEQTLIAARSAQQKNDAAALRKLYGHH